MYMTLSHLVSAYHSRPPPRVRKSILYVCILNHFFFLIDLFLAASGLRCCLLAFSSCGEQGLLFIAVCGLLIVVASLLAEHRL